ncbi:MAG: hypothetical protein GF313_07675, partial [Caldithrix sp.]|nr:hypothetical protein [Caldithrix sp.]
MLKTLQQFGVWGIVFALVSHSLIMADNNTQSGVRAVLLDESFENSFPPSGWASFSENLSIDGWQQTSDKSKTGSNSALAEPQYLYPIDIWLVTPAIDLTTADGAKLYFYEDGDGWENNG